MLDLSLHDLTLQVVFFYFLRVNNAPAAWPWVPWVSENIHHSCSFGSDSEGSMDWIIPFARPAERWLKNVSSVSEEFNNQESLICNTIIYIYISK